ncbi:MAG: 2Fe-2S iron-sulfur cluster binding domain-containing protein [Enterobacteriaceae bacterium]
MFLINAKETTFSSDGSRSLLQSMERAGLRVIPVGCRSGGCGICKVQILQGRYRVGKMSRSVISDAEQQQRVVLACRCFALSDIRLQTVTPPSPTFLGKSDLNTN